MMPNETWPGICTRLCGPPRSNYDTPVLLEPLPSPYRPFLPGWRSPLYLHMRPLWRALERVLATCEGRVIDVGCGMQPYRHLLGKGVVEYVGVDRQGALTNPTIEGTAEALPAADASFDVVLCTMVLEHVVDPRRVLAEARRVLKPNGRVVLTVPGVWPAHEVPHDYWRFTKFGLQQLMQEFELEGAISTLGGLWSVVGQMAVLALSPIRLARELVPFVNLAASTLDRIGSREDLGLAFMVDARLRDASKRLSPAVGADR
jgi:SAM-dependent methyltransferase